MKNICIVIVVCSVFASCQKAPQYPNTITMNDEGYKFTESSNPLLQSDAAKTVQAENVTVTLSKDLSGSSPVYKLSISVSTGSANALKLQNAYATTGQAGLYTINPQDTAYNMCTEFGPSGGQTYKISGGTVNITNANSSHVSGTFTLNVYNGALSSTITGNIDAHQPTFVN